jgi:ribose transport system permease protein
MRAAAVEETVGRLRYKYVPDHLVGEVLSKPWIDSAIPVAFLCLAVFVFSVLIPDFFSANNIVNMARQVAEIGLIALGMGIVVLSGGIDLSVAFVTALSILLALVAMNSLGWPVGVTLLACLGLGVVGGGINGVLIGYLRMRAFLTTLVTLIIYRSIYDAMFEQYAQDIIAGTPDSKIWDFLADGSVRGIPASLLITLAIYLVWHIVFTRMRPGWRLMAVGGARRSAHNAGINVRRTICQAYIWSGVLSALAGFLYAARLGSVGSDTGIGLEVTALTAVVLGGNTLGGGRGSVAKVLIGTVLVVIVTSSLIKLAIPGPLTSLILGCTLISAVFVDLRWLKNLNRIVSKVYLSPTYVALPKPASTAAGYRSPYAVNNKLGDVEIIGLGVVEEPEDVILDRAGNLYCGTRQGDIVRFLAPDHKKHEIFAHPGGHPLGMAFDRDENLVTCIPGMGVYKVSPGGEVAKITDETNRSAFSIIDDSRLKFADDLDIAPDGRIFFSEATIRYDMTTWPQDALESRPSGRIVCFNPHTQTTRTEIKRLVFPNGICMHRDGMSFFFAQTWMCRIMRYWFDGPKKGTIEQVIKDLPGYPDNINRASDGAYWFTLCGTRTPALDLALRMPAFRRRMACRVAPDEWMFPNLNTGCVLKFDDQGKILDALWDLAGVNHPMITSIREHDGYLYLAGVSNNRIGKYRIPGASGKWCAIDSYWGSKP